MASNTSHPERPPTLFFPATTNWVKIAAGAPEVHQSQNSKVEVAGTSQGPSRPPRAKRGSRPYEVPVVNKDPWGDYERSIEIFPKRHTFIASHRENKADLVHVQQLDNDSGIRLLLATASQCAHPSFLRLLHCYQHEKSVFLVWEPVEISLSQVIGSKYSISEAELVSIVWPVSIFDSHELLGPGT